MERCRNEGSYSLEQQPMSEQLRLDNTEDFGICLHFPISTSRPLRMDSSLCVGWERGMESIPLITPLPHPSKIITILVNPSYDSGGHTPAAPGEVATELRKRREKATRENREKEKERSRKNRDGMIKQDKWNTVCKNGGHGVLAANMAEPRRRRLVPQSPSSCSQTYIILQARAAIAIAITRVGLEKRARDLYDLSMNMARQGFRRESGLSGSPLACYWLISEWRTIDSELQCQTSYPDFVTIGFYGLRPTMVANIKTYSRRKRPSAKLGTWAGLRGARRQRRLTQFTVNCLYLLSPFYNAARIRKKADSETFKGVADVLLIPPTSSFSSTILHSLGFATVEKVITLILIGATVAERLARSPPTKANRAQSPAGSPDFRKWESGRAMPLVDARVSPLGNVRVATEKFPHPVGNNYVLPGKRSLRRCAILNSISRFRLLACETRHPCPEKRPPSADKRARLPSSRDRSPVAGFVRPLQDSYCRPPRASPLSPPAGRSRCLWQSISESPLSLQVILVSRELEQYFLISLPTAELLVVVEPGTIELLTLAYTRAGDDILGSRLLRALKLLRVSRAAGCDIAGPLRHVLCCSPRAPCAMPSRAERWRSEALLCETLSESPAHPCCLFLASAQPSGRVGTLTEDLKMSRHSRAKRKLDLLVCASNNLLARRVPSKSKGHGNGYVISQITELTRADIIAPVCVRGCLSCEVPRRYRGQTIETMSPLDAKALTSLRKRRHSSFSQLGRAAPCVPATKFATSGSWLCLELGLLVSPGHPSDKDRKLGKRSVSSDNSPATDAAMKVERRIIPEGSVASAYAVAAVHATIAHRISYALNTPAARGIDSGE
ncbi:hypothetical protein PR048_010563 [Dryococelus australis]|uniref:Uncharacterized protein n=1 Tax=Dryococelus australis TaxID=614101 RepID=A0ABQ9I487_9NEOP|nr:hypothetical protein PR048_010563 [Dryococelus australis]